MPFASDKQRRYLYSQEPDVAEKFASDEYENSGGIYPAPVNFNPGGDDAEIMNNLTTQREQNIDGSGPNGIRDRMYEEGDEFTEFPRYY